MIQDLNVSQSERLLKWKTGTTNNNLKNIENIGTHNQCCTTISPTKLQLNFIYCGK